MHFSELRGGKASANTLAASCSVSRVPVITRGKSPSPGANAGEWRFSLEGKKAPFESTVTRRSPLAITSMEGRTEPFGGWFSEGHGKLEAAPMAGIHSETDRLLIVNANLSVGVLRDK